MEKRPGGIAIIIMHFKKIPEGTYWKFLLKKFSILGLCTFHGDKKEKEKRSRDSTSGGENGGCEKWEVIPLPLFD